MDKMNRRSVCLLVFVSLIPFLLLGGIIALVVRDEYFAGTRHIYKGFSFETRDSIASEIQIDDPTIADIYVVLNGNAILASNITVEDLKSAGFEDYGFRSLRNSSVYFTLANFSASGQLTSMSIPQHWYATLSFSATSTGPHLKLPASVKEIKEHFGKPLKKEWIFVRPEWR